MFRDICTKEFSYLQAFPPEFPYYYSFEEQAGSGKTSEREAR